MSVARGMKAFVVLLAVGAVLAVEAGAAGANEFVTTFPTRAFFRAPEWQAVSVSPDGRYFATILRTAETREVRIYRRETSAYDVVVKVGPSAGLWFQWVGAETLVISAPGRPSAAWVHEVIRVSDKQHTVVESRHWLKAKGWIVDPLVQRDGEILLGQKRAVYRVDVRKLMFAKYRAVMFDAKYRVARHEKDVLRWVSDREGQIRGAYTFDDADGDESAARFKLWYRDPVAKSWRVIIEQSYDDRWTIAPLGFTDDGERILAASNRGRDRFALVELDVTDGEELALRYEHPTAELTGLEFDYATGEVVGVRYYDAGAHRTHYFSEAFEEERRQIARFLPERDILVESQSGDRDVVSFFASSDRDAGGYYLFDAKKQQVYQVGRATPWLDDLEFGHRRHFVVQAEGGPEVEAFFTVPHAGSGSKKPPLLVMPHGGPIGVLDGTGFDPVVQLLSHYGYAVLQINYRGSAGFGRAFQEAGAGQFGAGIEDDIDAAFDYVVAQGWVDEDRAGAVGSSYGGYSSLMSAIRHPERFRAVVNLMGVTDLPLLFDDISSRLSETSRKNRVELLGDPAERYDELLRNSPVYRAEELVPPILIIHGARDWNVDVDHAYRLRVMLDRYGKDYEFRILKDLDHSFGPPDTAQIILEDVLEFLHRHVMMAGSDSGGSEPPEPVEPETLVQAIE